MTKVYLSVFLALPVPVTQNPPYDGRKEQLQANVRTCKLGSSSPLLFVRFGKICGQTRRKLTRQAKQVDDESMTL